MTMDGKQSTHSTEFYLKEFELLRKQIEMHVTEMRTVERNVRFWGRGDMGVAGDTYGTQVDLVRPGVVRRSWGVAVSRHLD